MLEQKDLELIAGIVTKAIEPTNQRLDKIDYRLTKVETRLTNVETDIAELKADVAELKTDMVNVKADIAELKADVANLKTELTEVKDRVTEVESQVRNINLTLENEIRPKIQIVAEGHSVLNHKLDEALTHISKVAGEREEFQLRLVYLESELKKSKDMAC